MGNELVAQFLRESEAAGAGIHRVLPGELAETLVELLGSDQPIVAAAGIEAVVEELRVRGIRAVPDDDNAEAARALPAAAVGLGRALAAVAATGTLLVGPGSGLEGAIAILPARYVVLLASEDIHPDLAAALAGAAPLVAAPGARLVFITGPSRTSDIELTPVVGVHGPLRVDVVIVDG